MRTCTRTTPSPSLLFLRLQPVSSPRRKDDKEGAPPPAGSGSGEGGGKRGGGEGDSVPTAPSAAVVGAGASPAGELEFNMAAIDLSDMKVRVK